MRTALFDRMMAFTNSIVDSKKLDAFDTIHQYRIQGGLLERYYAVWMLLQKVKFSVLPLPHSFEGSHAQMSVYRQVRSFLSRTVRGLWKRITSSNNP